MKTSESELARRAGSYRQMFNQVKQGNTKTANIDLAIAVARTIGGKPLDYISENVRDMALKLHERGVYPDLKKNYRVTKKILRGKR